MEEKMKRSLTGNYFFKPTILGLILMVEIEYSYYDVPKENLNDEKKKTKHVIKDTHKEFIKASVSDAFELNLCAIPS